MEKKKLIPIIIIVLIVTIISMIALGNLIFFKINYPDFKLDSQNKIIIRTNSVYFSTINEYKNDIYYQIDFDNSVIYKVTEEYPDVFDDDQTIKKSRQNKKMDERFKQELSLLLSEVISNETENELEKNRAKTEKYVNGVNVDVWDSAKYKFYEIIGLNFEKKIYNEDSYMKLVTFFKNIEEFK
jgi:hypothetical protein